ncbi:MAG: hypothetical protein RLN76_00650 [Phycisphaeraceae bacterium]
MSSVLDRQTSTVRVGAMTPAIVEERVRLGARLLKAAQDRLEAREELNLVTASALDDARTRLAAAEKRVAEQAKALDAEKQRRVNENEALKQALGILTQQLASSERAMQQLQRRVDLQDRHLSELSTALIKLESRPAAMAPVEVDPRIVAEAVEQPLTLETQTTDAQAGSHQKRPVYGKLLAQLRQQVQDPVETTAERPSAA